MALCRLGLAAAALTALLVAGCRGQPESGRPASPSAPVPASQPAQAPEPAAIAWGKAVDGLQVGLRVLGSHEEMHLKRIAVLTRLLAKYTGPGHRLPVAQALAKSAKDRTAGNMSGFFKVFRQEVEAGRSLSEVLQRYWQPANRELIEGIEAGKAAGDLHGAFVRLAASFARKARPRGYVVQGERICAVMYLRNVGETNISLRSHRTGLLDLSFAVDGKAPVFTHTPAEAKGPPIRPTTLPAGGKIAVESWWIQHWFAPNRPIVMPKGHACPNALPPGRHSIVAAYAHPKHRGGDCPYWHGQAVSAPVALEIRPDPAAPKVAWGPAVNGLRAAIVPRGVPEKEDWRQPTLCPACSTGLRKNPPSVCKGCGGHSGSIYHKFCERCALARRVCRGCGALRAPGARFVEGQPIELEFRFKDLGDKDLVLGDAGHISQWRFEFVPKAGGATLIGHYDTAIKENRRSIDISVPGRTTVVRIFRIGARCVFDTTGRGSSLMNDPKVLRSLPPGRYTMTASYEHAAGHATREPCPFWHGKLTTRAVEIEVRPKTANRPRPEGPRRVHAEGVAALR